MSCQLPFRFRFDMADNEGEVKVCPVLTCAHFRVGRLQLLKNCHGYARVLSSSGMCSGVVSCQS